MDEARGGTVGAGLEAVWHSALGALDVDVVEYDPALERFRWCERGRLLNRCIRTADNHFELQDVVAALEHNHRLRLARELASGQRFELPFKTTSAQSVWIEWIPVQGGAFYICRETTERHRYAQQVIQAIDRMQQKFAENLHDDICQQLAGMHLLGQHIEWVLKKHGLEEAVDAAELCGFLADTLERTRLLSRGLCTNVGHTLAERFSRLVQEVERLFKVRCRLHLGSPPALRDTEKERMLFQIAREAVCNAAKHSGGAQIEISLEQVEDMLVMRVCDDGAGIAPEAAHGMGLDLMRNRALEIGARIMIRRLPHGGTEVACELPLP